jgi:para-aminobenzoate synthetase
MRILLVDNYDSFTFNLAQALRRAGADVEVRYHDVVETSPAALARFDALVLSPGPGRADRPADVGACHRVLDRADPQLPVLGVCLGHQLLALREGAGLVRAPRVMHGKVSRLVHDGSGPFADLGPDVAVMRYHSWAVDAAALPGTLAPTAWAEDGTLMAFAHRSRPRWGLQFHPESVGTPEGPRMLERFLVLARQRTRARSGSSVLRAAR